MTQAPVPKSGDVGVSDRREHPFFVVDNDIIKKYGRQLGPYGIAVYAALAMHAGRDAIAWPSYQTIADEIGASRRQVMRSIGVMVELGIIAKEQRSRDTGETTSNRYELKSVNGVSQSPPGAPQSLPSDSQSLPLVTVSHPPSDCESPKQESVNKTQFEQDPGRGEGDGSRAGAPSPLYFDASKLVDGRMPAGRGANPVEVYLEIFSLQEMRHRRAYFDPVTVAAIDGAISDLSRWRAALKAWKLAGHSMSNFAGMIDWYRDGPPSARKATPAFGLQTYAPRNGANHAPSIALPADEITLTPEQIAEFKAINRAIDAKVAARRL